ncbi:MAG TPA: sulfatase-like hydrolase/transferase [Acidobacteriaceae bacterium]
MKRRDFLKSSAALSGASLMSGLGFKKLLAQNTAAGGSRPNILLILVDELRYPTVFPQNIQDATGFFKEFMPHLYKRLWTKGVKFDNHHTAANACTPSRGVMISGLYSQQSWLLTTIVAPPNPSPILLRQPVLNTHYPTYGKLLRKLGYQTPYRGKWHVSIPQQNAGGLEAYGFDYATYPDPTGANLQGTYGDETRGYHNDEYIATQAVDVLSSLTPGDQPFCLTVSFVNPHDREFFPFGTEFGRFNDLFADTSKTNPNNLSPQPTYPGTGPNVPYSEDKLKDPPEFGYPDLPPNWENTDDWKDQHKPSTQTFIKAFQNLFWGGASEDPQQDDFTILQYPAPDLNNPTLGIPYGPFSYWRRGLDSYTQIIKKVDKQIGKVLDALEDLPPSIVENTVIVFCSDHGEYSGAHGLLQGKMGTVYEEAWHIPLIVVDPSGRFTGDLDDIRGGLTSSVDLLPMLVSLGDLGSTGWMSRELSKIYGQRHDMISMLKSKDAPGRPYVLLATDEIAPNVYNFNSAPTHVLGFRTDEYKFGISAPWFPTTSDIVMDRGELEFYDYSTTGGQMELINTLDDPRAQQTLAALLNNIIPNELQQPLPPRLRLQQLGSKAAHLIYRAILENIDPQTLNANGGIRGLLGYGGEF